MSKPIFDQPYGLKYQVDGIRMELSWRPDFGAEKTAALQKAQFALAQEAARLIDSYVPFDTGQLKNSVQTAEGTDLRSWHGAYDESGTWQEDKYKGLRGSYWGQRALADVGEHLALFGAKAVTTFWGGMGHL